MQQTRTAVIALSDDGVVIVRVSPDVLQSLADAKDNLATALDVRNGKPRPILVDISVAMPLEGEVRRFYSGNFLAGFTAMALLIPPNPLGRMIGNIYLRIANVAIPTRLFTDETSALKWLRP